MMELTLSALAVAGAGGVSAMHEWSAATMASANGECVFPGRCVPPATSFSNVVVGPVPGQQWNINGGFCGSWSTQQNALSAGAYISQDLVRKSNRNSQGEHFMHGNRAEGYEVMPSNVAFTLASLRLRYDEFDYNQPRPQATAFKRWAKSHLANGAPIVFFPMCKGDAHQPYRFSCPNGGHVDHVETMYGLYSNHPLNDSNVYPDDWIVHTSDQDGQPYFRQLDLIEDTPSMDGNCKAAVAGFGHNEMFPCIDSEVTYGAAVLGLDVDGTLPLTLEVNQYQEPNVRLNEAPQALYGLVTVSGLVSGQDLTLYRYNSTEMVPQSRAQASETAERAMRFTASGDSLTFSDPLPFMSNSAVYYIAI